jgi:hypothetical protein
VHHAFFMANWHIISLHWQGGQEGYSRERD